MKQGAVIMLVALLYPLTAYSVSDALAYFNKPMSRLDFAMYTLGTSASARIRDVIIESQLSSYASHGEVIYVEDPLEIRIHAQIWGLSKDNTSEETCHSLLLSYAKKMSPDETFWAQLGPSNRDDATMTAKLGEQIAEHVVYEVFLDQLPVNYEKRIKCSLKDDEI